MMTFVEFIETLPGLGRFAIRRFEHIHDQADLLGAKLAAKDETVLRTRIASLRLRAADPAFSPSLQAQNSLAADALERDPTGKLAAVPALRAWAAQRDGIGNTWINWYVVLLNSYIDAQKAPSIVPMQVTQPMEAVS